MLKASTSIGCRNVSKMFRCRAATSARLQDAILHRGRRRQWTVEALRDVSMDVRTGEWVGIAGPNGSGKTTLLRILGGLTQSDRGSVHTTTSVTCFFGLGAGFHPDLTLEENIYLHSLMHGLSSSKSRECVDAVIAEAEVQSYRFMPLKSLSTGMAMRLGFASAMTIDSDVYLLDEVAAVGDERFQRHSMERLRGLKAQGKTAVLVSHNADVLSALCDRTLRMEQGRIV